MKNTTEKRTSCWCHQDFSQVSVSEPTRSDNKSMKTHRFSHKFKHNIKHPAPKPHQANAGGNVTVELAILNDVNATETLDKTVLWWVSCARTTSLALAVTRWANSV